MDTKLSDFERQHAESIMDEHPVLEPIPTEARTKILVGSVLRKPKIVLQAFLAALEAQEVEGNVDLYFLFVDDGLDAEAKAAVEEWLSERDGELAQHELGREEGDYRESTGTTRGWTPKAWHRVGALKNRIFQTALSGAYDFIWHIDADVICDPRTLQSLLDAEKPIVAAVYWTKWQRPTTSGEIVHAGPQVWVQHPYTLFGNAGPDGIYEDEAAFRRALIERRLARVGGLGACTLFAREVVEAGVHFAPVGALPPGPMSDGEDRHLCWRANALHVPMYGDAWPNVWHAFHPQEYAGVGEARKKLSAPLLDRCTNALDHVSVTVEPLDWPSGKQWMRGRLATLPTLPEIIEHLATMKRRQKKVIRVHFPLTYPHPQLRGKIGTVQIRLLDVRRYTMPPVIDEEMFVGSLTGAWMDTTTLTQEQVDSVLEEAREDG